MNLPSAIELPEHAVRYKLTVAYDGTDFVGWQKQEPPDPDAPPPANGEEPKRLQLRTVQHVVEQAIRETIREPISLQGASRTDSGVHALGQVAAFTSIPDQPRGIGWPADRGSDNLIRALNSRLPRDVLITKAETVPLDFNPISGAIEHRDSMGNVAQIPAGDFQLMNAGTGITHSEYNPSRTLHSVY